MQTNYRNFKYCKSEFQFSDSPDIGISKKNSDRSLQNRKQNQNFASDGGLRNWNQKSEFPTKVSKQSRWILKQRRNADFEVYTKRIQHSVHLIKYLETFMPNDGHR